MKQCSKCLEILPFTSFNKKGHGLTSQCKGCLGVYYRKKFQTDPERRKQVSKAVSERRRVLAKIIQEIKSVPCADCGLVYPTYVMDFDHRDPSQKLDNVAGLARRGWSEARIRAEIEKCDVVCANCHRIRTHKRR